MMISPWHIWDALSAMKAISSLWVMSNTAEPLSLKAFMILMLSCVESISIPESGSSRIASLGFKASREASSILFLSSPL